jgi:hypothetical protein
VFATGRAGVVTSWIEWSSAVDTDGGTVVVTTVAVPRLRKRLILVAEITITNAMMVVITMTDRMAAVPS